MLLDIGHLHRTSTTHNYDPYDFAKEFRKKIFELHVHDVKEEHKDHFAVGAGSVDFKKYFKAVGRAKLRKIPIVFEYNNSVTEEEALKGKEIVEKLVK
jgi:sugar phosphate isomerase/epimerase